MNPLAKVAYDNRTRIAAVLAVLALCGFSFGLGRMNQDEHIVYQDRIQIQEKIVAQLVYRDREETKVDEVKNVKIARNRVVVEVKRPDGTVETTTREREASESTEAKIEIRYVDRVVESKVEVEKKVDRLVYQESTKALPDWRLGLTVGASPLRIVQKGTLGVEDLVVGAELQRRIVGPLSATFSLASDTSFGLGLNLEF